MIKNNRISVQLSILRKLHDNYEKRIYDAERNIETLGDYYVLGLSHAMWEIEDQIKALEKENVFKTKVG